MTRIQIDKNDGAERYPWGHCENCDNYVAVGVDLDDRTYYCKYCLEDVYMDGSNKV